MTLKERPRDSTPSGHGRRWLGLLLIGFLVLLGVLIERVGSGQSRGLSAAGACGTFWQ